MFRFCMIEKIMSNKGFGERKANLKYVWYAKTDIGVIVPTMDKAGLANFRSIVNSKGKGK